MQSLLKNKLIIFLLTVIVLTLIFKQNSSPLPLPVIAKEAKKTVVATPVAKQTITPNPDKLSSLKNPFKPLNESLAIDAKPLTTTPTLTGIISQGHEFLAIISLNGKSDFYKPHQKIAGYILTEINSTSVVLQDEHDKKRLILHIKE